MTYKSATFRPAADAALDRPVIAGATSCRGGAVGACLLVLVAIATFSAPAARAAACPNEAFRAQSPQLADCRAYEMVSPADMNGNGIEQGFAIGADGNGVVYGTLNAFGEAQSSVAAKWVARRSGEGWTSASLNPLTAGRVPSAYDEPVVMASASDLSRILIGSRYPFDPLDQAPYVSLTKPGNGDLYRVAAGNSSEWISHGPVLPDTTLLDRALGGASADLSRIFFETKEPLTAETAGSTAVNLYEWDEGALRSVNVEAAALIAGGARVGRGQGSNASFYPGEFSAGNSNQGQPVDSTAVSADGSVVFFTAPVEPASAPRQVYASVAGEAVLASKCLAGACESQPAPNGALFLVAPSDGSAVLFYSSGPLTATAPAAGGIYRFDVGTKELSFLTEVGAANTGANFGGVLAASPDGAYLYLCENGAGISVYHEGQVTSVAPVPCNASVGEASKSEPTALRAGVEVAGVKGIKQGEPHITPAAGYLFVSTEKIGSYENAGKAEVYLYEPSPAELRCLSCRPDGGAAQGNSFLNKAAAGSGSTPTPISSGIPVQNLSVTGERAFFVSEEALVPADVNGAQDVYQWERPDSRDCTVASAAYSAGAGGCVSLVSSGRDLNGAVLEGATPSGDDIFFSSYESLVPADTGTELQLYDARVGGGLATQHQGPAATCSDEQGCRGPGSAESTTTKAGSTSSTGGGNASGRCVKLTPLSRRLAKQARELRRQAQALRGRRPQRAHHLSRRAKLTAKRARKLAKQARQCPTTVAGANR